MDIVISQELQYSLLLSSLTEHHILPLYTRIYGAFQTNFPPPSYPDFPAGNYLYVRMELNNCGDMETYLRKGNGMNTMDLVSVFFQMVLSLYTANSVVCDCDDGQ